MGAPPDSVAGPLVYYVRRGALVKIGHTADLVERLRSLYPDELLAVEPGGRVLEVLRHRQFEADRADDPRGPEWFRASSALLRHIAALTARPPVPTIAELLGARPRAMYPTDDPAVLVPTVRDGKPADLDVRDLLAGIRAAEGAIASAPGWTGQLVRELRRRGESWRDIADRTGVPRTTLERRVLR